MFGMKKKLSVLLFLCMRIFMYARNCVFVCLCICVKKSGCGYMQRLNYTKNGKSFSSMFDSSLKGLLVIILYKIQTDRNFWRLYSYSK